MIKVGLIWWQITLTILFLGDRVGRSFLWQGYINTSGPFSAPWSNQVMIILMIMILAGTLLIHFHWPRFQFITFIIIFAGLNNLVDRLVFGGVIDYWPWFGLGHFNFSDIMLFVALGLFLFTLCQAVEVRHKRHP